MEGYGPDKGVSPRAVAELFNIVESSKNEWSYALTFSMLEIYNESILDLLDKSPIKVAHSAALCPALSCHAIPCPVLSYLTLIHSFMSWFIV
jgi:Kinesin motor domain